MRFLYSIAERTGGANCTTRQTLLRLKHTSQHHRAPPLPASSGRPARAHSRTAKDCDGRLQTTNKRTQQTTQEQCALARATRACPVIRTNPKDARNVVPRRGWTLARYGTHAAHSNTHSSRNLEDTQFFSDLAPAHCAAGRSTGLQPPTELSVVDSIPNPASNWRPNRTASQQLQNMFAYMSHITHREPCRPRGMLWPKCAPCASSFAGAMTR